MLRNILISAMTFGLFCLSAQGSDITDTFNSYPDGTTDLGNGTTIVDSGSGLAQIYDYGSWKALRLTQDGADGVSMTGNFILPDLDSGQAITGFTATFDLLIKNDYNNVADGFSFNFGAISGTLPVGSEEGMYNGAAGDMLSIGWDTYDNGEDPNSIEVYINGSSVANNTSITPIVAGDLNGPFRSVSIVLDENGLLDVTYDGQAVFTDLDVSAFVPEAGDQFAFAARTGGENEDVFIDNVSITTVPEPATMGLLALGGLALLRKRRKT